MDEGVEHNLPSDIIFRIAGLLLNDHETFSSFRLSGKVGLEAANFAVRHIRVQNVDQLRTLGKQLTLPSRAGYPGLETVAISSWFPILPSSSLWSTLRDLRHGRLSVMVSDPSPELWRAIGEVCMFPCL